MKLISKVAIVTGGSSGIGLAAVELLLSKGVKVMIGDLNPPEINLSLIYPSQVSFQKTDVSSEESIKLLIETTIKLYNSIHIVINSAGVGWAEFTASHKAVHSSESFTLLYKINVLGTFNVCKYAAQQIVKQTPFENNERAVFINIASIAGYEGQKGNVAYAASKAAVLAMTLPMARDLGKYGIRVCCIAPGIIETPMGKSIDQRVRKILVEQTAVGRFGNTTEVADICLGLIENSYCTGNVWRIDGGMRLAHF